MGQRSTTTIARWVLVLAAILVAGTMSVVARASIEGQSHTQAKGQSDPGEGEPSESPADEESQFPAKDEPLRGTYRAFTPDSWWNTPLPDHAPTHPYEDEILRFMRTAPESGPGCLRLAGAGENPWGTPLYWAETLDEEYNVAMTSSVSQPPELQSLRIPDSAAPADNSDGSMSVYDLDKGYVVALTQAAYDDDSDSWSAAGATVTYLDSNGLHVRTGASNDARNRGSHRGNNGATMAVPWDQVQDGQVRHVLKVAAGPTISKRYIFPMVGSDGDYIGNDPAVPPQGLRMRIRSSVDLDSHGLDEEALVIARALQRYGLYLGDSGGTTALKLENTVVAGRGQLWKVKADALCDLPFEPEYWDVIAEHYDRRR